MSTAPNTTGRKGDPPALSAAIRYLRSGFWPVPIYDPNDPEEAGKPRKDRGKRPIGKEWGASRPTEESLRATWAAHPGAGVGLKMGLDAGIIDVEIDDAATGFDTLRELFGEIPKTMGYESNRGPHYIFKYDPRVARWNRSKLTYKGVEFRFGTIDPADPKQMQSVVPPSVKADDMARQWHPIRVLGTLPDHFFERLDAALKAEEAKAAPARPEGVIPMARPTREATAVEKYVLKAVKDEFDLLENATEGHRNEQLYLSALRLGSLVGAGAMTAENVESQLGVSAQRLGLPMREARATIRSGVENGMKQPRDLSGIGHVNKKAKREEERAKVYAEAEAAPYEWSPPRARGEIPPVPFPVDVFPPSLAELCRLGAVAMQCPVDYLASAAVGLAGAAIGLSVNVAVKRGWVESPNLYVATVGPPGTRKSPAYRLLSRVFFAIDRDLQDMYRQQLNVWEQRKEAKEDDLGPPPVRRHLTIDDATKEAIGQIHDENPRGLAVIKDELAGWMASMNAYRGAGDDLQFWMTLNSGSPVKVNRKGNKEVLVIPRPCVSVLGPLTPSSLPAMTGEGLDNGWLDRILFSYPAPLPRTGWSEEEVPQTYLDDWASAVRDLFNLPMEEVNGHPSPHYIRFDDAGKKLFIDWINGHQAETQHPDFSAALVGPWSKIEGFCARFALILSRLRTVYDPTIDNAPRDVGEEDTFGAIRLAEYFKVHFKRVRHELSRSNNESNDDAAMILRWVLKHHPERFRARHVTQYYGYLGDDRRDAALGWLIAHGYIRELTAPPRPKGRVGRPPSQEYEVNPFVRDPSLVPGPPEAPPSPGEVAGDETSTEEA